ncbi:hypothetical protein PMAYCL1PPCAC_11634, partial [Pristionchus mayeri]
TVSNGREESPGEEEGGAERPRVVRLRAFRLLNRGPSPFSLDLEQFDVRVLKLLCDYRLVLFPSRLQKIIGDHRERIVQLSERVRCRLKESGHFDGVEHPGAQQPSNDEDDDVHDVTKRTKEGNQRMSTHEIRDFWRFSGSMESSSTSSLFHFPSHLSRESQRFFHSQGVLIVCRV